MTKQTDKVVISAKPRQVLGKRARRLRRQGLIPGNIYGQGQASTAIQLEKNQFRSLLTKHGGDLGLVYLHLDSKEEPVLVTEVTRHPVYDEIIHVEFMRVNLKQAVETEVAIEVVGEVDVPNTVLEVIRDEIKIKALPEDIPEHIEVDVSSLTEPGQIITIADLNYDKTKLTLLVDETDMDKPVVILQEVKEEVEVVEPETEVETEGETGEADKAQDQSPETTKETTKQSDQSEKTAPAEESSKE